MQTVSASVSIVQSTLRGVRVRHSAADRSSVLVSVNSHDYHISLTKHNMLKSDKSDDRPFRVSRRHNFGWMTLKRKLLNSERLSLRRKQSEQSSYGPRQQALKSVSIPKKKKKACCQNHELNVSCLSLTLHDRLINLENGTLKKKPCSHSHYFDSTCHPVPDTIIPNEKPKNESRLNFDKQDVKSEELDEDEGWFSREASETSDLISCQVKI